MDLRFALRPLAGRPAFTAIAPSTLALCIGANAAVSSLVYTVLLRPFSFPEPDELVHIHSVLGEAANRARPRAPTCATGGRTTGRSRRLASYYTWNTRLTDNGVAH
jgi:hypothetical protein